MKLNWKLRLKNKPVLVALIATLVAFIYQVLGIFGVVPAISEHQVVEWFGLIINLLVALGVVVDPSTAGVKDTDLAMTYTEPRKEVETVEDIDEAEESEDE